jgi:hypothetical protein
MMRETYGIVKEFFHFIIRALFEIDQHLSPPRSNAIRKSPSKSSFMSLRYLSLLPKPYKVLFQLT